MKFSYVVGNPPFQTSNSDNSNQAKPLYNYFVEEAKKICENDIVMITPSRWFSGGIGLDSFRENMLKENKIRRIQEFANGKECFPSTSISGGVSFFVWDKDYDGPCEFTNISNGDEQTMTRYLNEYPILVRDNMGVNIIRKVKALNEESLSSKVSAISPFALSTKVWGKEHREEGMLRLYSSKGISYIESKEVDSNNIYTNKYKAMVSQTGAEHAGEPAKDGTFRVLTSSMQVLQPGDVCTHSYILIGPYDTQIEPTNIIKYLKTKFVRYLVLQAVASIHISRTTFLFVPVQNFSDSSKIDWSQEISEINKQLYKKYNLNKEEIEYIEKKIKEMV